MSQRLKNFVKLFKNYCCTNRNTSLSAVCWRSGTTMVLHWTSGSRSGLVAMCCSYYDYQSNEMRKIRSRGFDHKNDGVISGNFLVSNGNGIPRALRRQLSIMKARQKRSNDKLPLKPEPIPCDNKRFQKLSSRLKQLKIVVSVTRNSHSASFYTVE